MDSDKGRYLAKMLSRRTKMPSASRLNQRLLPASKSRGGMCLRAARQMDLLSPGEVGRVESEGV